MLVDAMLPVRLTQSAFELTAGLAAASMAAWGEMARGQAELWSRSCATAGPGSAVTHTRTTRSWYRQPDTAPQWPSAAPLAMPLPWLTPAPAALQPALPALPAAYLQAAAIAAPWLRMWPSATLLPVWPMAVSLMAAGLPQAAAWPTAEATLHAMAATQKAAEGLEQLFSSYRSDGGHATAQIEWTRRLH